MTGCAFPMSAIAGMMEYDGDLKIPRTYLVQPPDIDKTISEYLALSGCRQLAISETQKFGHVTYFWNGNNSEKVQRGAGDLGGNTLRQVGV